MRTVFLHADMYRQMVVEMTDRCFRQSLEARTREWAEYWAERHEWWASRLPKR